jgi:hypothetical protein
MQDERVRQDDREEEIREESDNISAEPVRNHLDI